MVVLRPSQEQFTNTTTGPKLLSLFPASLCQNPSFLRIKCNLGWSFRLHLVIVNTDVSVIYLIHKIPPKVTRKTVITLTEKK